ncbi:hypothetical protein SBA5_820002 [Candidatus Sulfotelmatomonas gaucii]|uniref:Uncharacterized protein n=1 Tax=Candidatus Sulfuritelmatomonas gaucii TaxID=2043161 RepID=A0A2N9M675_9BACT|nr:hypothetical protein SBA5_820002 [Candidatus Sulfotelmatomonas gaucii]
MSGDLGLGTKDAENHEMTRKNLKMGRAA